MSSPSVRWLFLDLNSFFASVEQLDHPELRGRPVAVVPMMAETTSAIAASQEAKKFGIKTGTLLRDARQYCPEVVFVEARHDRYIEIHHQVIEIVHSCIPVTAVLSIDEMVCELIGSEKNIERATEIVREIKRQLSQRIGPTLTASVGLAPNRFLAKVASDMQKPDGLTILTSENLEERLKRLKLRDFPGIGAQMEKRLLTAGIYNTEILLSASQAELKQVWGGVLGEHFYEWLRGRDTETTETKQRSISHSHVLGPALRNEQDAYRVLQKLTHKVAFRLRKDEMWCKRMTVILTGLEEQKKEITLKFMECQDDFSLLKQLEEAWRHLQQREGWRGFKWLKVAVWLQDLVPDSEHHFSLFENQKGWSVSKKLDEINSKFGRGTVYFAGVGKSGELAPSRIAFQSIPDLDSD